MWPDDQQMNQDSMIPGDRSLPNDRPVAITNKRLPQLRSLRKLLNSVPLKHEDWVYQKIYGVMRPFNFYLAQILMQDAFSLFLSTVPKFSKHRLSELHLVELTDDIDFE